jgi:hypothetical protein
VRTPVTDMPDERGSAPTPVTWCPQQPGGRRDYPGSWNPEVTTVRVIRPIAWGPDVAGCRANRLRVDRNGRRSDSN